MDEELTTGDPLDRANDGVPAHRAATGGSCAAARGVAADARDRAADAREAAADARDLASAIREAALRERELASRIRDEDVRARVELDAALAERDALLGQMRHANERLVVATLAADELAELANAALEAAAYNERRFRALAGTTAAVIWRAEPSGAIHIEQDSREAFTGGALDADPVWGWLQAIPVADRAAVREAWSHALATQTPYLCQHRIRTRDGDAWVIARAVPVVVAGVLREWIGMMTDITDRMRIEEAKDLFIGILGHDLRNPLSAIALGAEVFRSMPEPHTRVAAQILRSVRRMSVMIRDMMDFTRGRLGGGIPVTRGPCDLGKLGLEVVAELKQAHPTRDIQCETIGDLSGICDTDRVEQVLSNLVGNAITHGRDPIGMTIREEGDEVLTIVHNAGTPIPAALLPTLFEPFLRGGSATGAREGLGLGLYIVREIVKAHGGSIKVTSTWDAGTEVVVRWPRDRAAPPAAHRAV